MKWLGSLSSAGEGLLDRILCVVGAVVFTQFPEFFQQYLQRLGGHLDEARRQLLQFQVVAAKSNLTVETLAHRTSLNADGAVAKLGTVITGAIERVHELETAHSALQHATMWTRPFVFVRYADESIARATWGIFKPAVPTTLEGLAYALVGMLLFLGIYHGAVKYPLSCWAIRARRKRAMLGKTG